MQINFKDLDDSLQKYLSALRGINKDLNFELIENAYRLAWNAHSTQLRKSGEPYIMHPVSVSIICAEIGMGTTTIASALMHDVIEDTEITYEMLAEQFSDTIAKIVDGVTKIESMQHSDKEQRKVETYRKILLNTAKDIRVIIIKFADRIHNLRTLTYMSDGKKKLIAEETLKIYAPLAHRLGMGNIKTELEDLAFRHILPDKYQEVLEETSANEHKREEIIYGFRKLLNEKIDELGIDAEVFGRTKSYYSIYKKNRDRQVPYNEIFDLLAMRIICDSQEECYQLLGLVHSLWTPVPDKLKDYIASPKSNGYQSIHTTVAGPKGNIVEIQIRTWEMNYIAEEGIAAHWRYKNKENGKRLEDSSALQWLRNLVEWQKELSDSVEFYEFFKIDIEHSEITVRTPKNEKVNLPVGATIIDFAFAIHSEIGLHCIGGVVNGHIEKPDKKLHNGDLVEVLHSFDKKPNIEWLQEVRTPRARSEIKRWIKRVENRERVSMGKQLLYNEFATLHLNQPLSDFFAEIFDHFNFSNEESMFEHVALNSVLIKDIIEFLNANHGPKKSVKSIVKSLENAEPRVVVDGVDSVMVRYASCCHPLPGDAIVGFATHGRGISVHRLDCPNAAYFMSDDSRMVKLSWDDGQSGDTLDARIVIEGTDRSGLIKEIACVFEAEGLSISEFNFACTGSHAKATIKLAVESLQDLFRIKRKLRTIEGVSSVARHILKEK